MKGSITAYRMGTQFSMVTHWKTVNMASPMLSKEVMPGEQNRDITINQPAGGFSWPLTCIGPGPLLQADRDVCITQIGTPGGVGRIAKETRRPNLTLGHHLV